MTDASLRSTSLAPLAIGLLVLVAVHGQAAESRLVAIDTLEWAWWDSQTSWAHYVVGFNVVPADLAAGGTYLGAVVVSVNRAASFAGLVTQEPAVLEAGAQLDPNVRYLLEDPLVQMVAPWSGAPETDPNGEGELPPNDPLFAGQYGVRQVRAPEAWATSRGSTAARVCLVDSGIRYTHEDLVGERWMGGYNFVNGNADPADDYGHGTHVAGIAAATTNNLKGIAGAAQVEIYAVKVLRSNGQGTIEWVANGITWCATQAGPRTVISVSLSNPIPVTTLEDVVEHAYTTRGMLVVASAGNAGPCTECIRYPAAYDEVVAVTCTTLGGLICLRSSTGSQAEIAAPGDAILSTYNANDASYHPLGGTSQSTALVSGAAALVWSQHTSLTNVALRERLGATAEDLGPTGWDDAFGSGELDVKCFLDGVAPCG